MNAADVMVTNVITVGPDACLQDVAHLFLTNRISAAPVVGTDGKIVGIVSEGDLMRRAEAGTGRRRSWWLSLLTGREVLAAEYIKEHSRKVADVMTREVITAAPQTSLRDIANILEKNGIKRVPIVDGGKIIGIVKSSEFVASAGKLAQTDRRRRTRRRKNSRRHCGAAQGRAMEPAIADQRHRAGGDSRALGDCGTLRSKERRCGSQPK